MLENWTSPIPYNESEVIQNLSKEQFGRNIAIYVNDFPDLKKVDVAIIGVSKQAAEKVRQSLYTLDYPFNALRIADLGNIRNEDPSFLIPMLKELLESDIVPVIIGQSTNSSYAQFQAYSHLKRATNLVCIDEKIRYSYSNTNQESYYLNNILNAKESNLFNFGIVGFQGHYTPEVLLQMLDERNFDYSRLGNLKKDIQEAEPLIRDADLLCFNMNALKHSDAPGVENPSPNGLFGEEACQISRYAGISDKLTSIGFYGFSEKNDKNNQTAQVIAQLIWYFLDGYYSRMNDFPASMNSLVEYIVDFKNIETPITFWKSAKSGRWWMQVPVEAKEQYQRHKLIPCSYNDYQSACQDNFPNRLLNAYKRFS